MALTYENNRNDPGLITAGRRLLKQTDRIAALIKGLLPDFLIIGSQKCGTTSLYNYLTSHPYVRPTRAKEVGYFDRYHKRGIKWYKSQFPSSLRKYYETRLEGHPMITGEASTGYILYPHALRRIARTVPDAKLILILRNPVDRAYSHYHHSARDGYEHLCFEEAVDKEQERIGEEYRRILEDENYYSDPIDHYAYVTTGIYIDQVKVLMELFPADQVLILSMEDMSVNPQLVMDQVLAYLNMPAMILAGADKFNAGDYGAMSEETRRNLIERFRPYNMALYQYLGRNFGWDK